MNTQSEQLSAHQKALAINLDQNIYGTVAEIGAGQEVARWLFRVGGAAGSIAKTMSAYDMKVSDEVYGKCGRYVSRERVVAMLDKEYGLLDMRLGDERRSHTRFFAYANTVAARSFTGSSHCHGWIGLRFQTQPDSEPNTLILHVNMLDRTNLRQQEALGLLGINLIYAAFHTENFTEDFLRELFDELSPERLEIDLICATGPAFSQLSDLDIGLTLVENEMALGILFGPDGAMEAVNEIIHKRPLVLERGLFRTPAEIKPDIINAAATQLRNESPDNKDTLAMLELSVNNLREKESVSYDGYRKRLQNLTQSGERVLLTRLKESYALTDYLRRYSQAPMRFSMGVSSLALLFGKEFYAQLPGGLLEATGKLFANNVRLYVHDMPSDAFHRHIDDAVENKDFVMVTNDSMVSIESLEFRGPLSLLYHYVVETGWVIALK
ncbi:MAG: TonB-dependent receptor [Gammaproteobacteria bacterium]|nr:TonB-dependent receptor [Gammaproteobacteria bacterium]